MTPPLPRLLLLLQNHPILNPRSWAPRNSTFYLPPPPPNTSFLFLPSSRRKDEEKKERKSYVLNTTPPSWDSLYTTELTNHAHDPSDRGTVWFDDSDAETKVLEFLEDHVPKSKEEEEEGTCFLDLGCGNGSLLFALRAEGWRGGRMLGIDYSEQSIALAKQIASSSQEQNSEEEEDEEKDEDEVQGQKGQQDSSKEAATKVEFAVWDLLRGDYNDGVVLSGAQADGWDVVLDKGTFDAISLSEDRDEQGRRICEGYKARVLRLVKKGGLFLVTSCNWTEAELEGWFGHGSGDVEGASFVNIGRVKYPSFSFGGVKGQTISTLCFQRR